MSKLKLCPFCGEQPELDYPAVTEINGHEYQEPEIECKCGIVFGFKWDNENANKCSCCHDLTDELVKLWNVRNGE